MPVNHDISLGKDVFELLAETASVLTVEMNNDDGVMIYSVTFDGSQIDGTHHSIELKKSYGANTDNIVIAFADSTKLPEGTILKRK